MAGSPEGRATKAALTDYAELHCLSAFSFQRGASTALELFERAKALGYRALAITDECSFAGLVRGLEASEATGLPLICGTEVQLADGPTLVLLVESTRGYERLSALITTARRRAAKGTYALHRADLEAAFGEGMGECDHGVLALWLPTAEALGVGRSIHDDEVARKLSGPALPSLHPATDTAAWLRGLFPDRLWLGAQLHRGADDDARRTAIAALAAHCGLPVVACGDVHMHLRRRRGLQDVLCALRHRATLREAGRRLFPNGERHLRTRQALAAIFPRAWLEESVAIAARCRFRLRDLKYDYPCELVPEGETPSSWLATLTWDGAALRWPEGLPEKVRTQIEAELALIAELKYEAFFLTVHDLVVFARSRGILCQGRGSAANSAVCYALGITAVDPARANLLFGRFLSKERDEPPDIDVDFEHERREEVIQYVYAKYGRERAALAATVITYGPKSALRDVGRVMGLPEDQLAELSAAVGHAEDFDVWKARCRERGLDPDGRLLAKVLMLAHELLDHPRHLSQHVGGFVISDAPLSRLVPVENAAMADRTIIQWDKDDLETLGLLKVDVLALGMLSAIRRCLDLLRANGRRHLELATIPAEDAETYRMIQRADTLGVFQIESRAQMTMLPRLKPRTFYDLVIEVAIVRPGPIQGGMVHPYLRRRQGIDPVLYPSKALETVLGRTLGVPLFQEQVMEIAMVAAGYTAGEADGLRRSMAAWKRRGGLEHHRQRLLAGMAERGYPPDFAEQIFEQVKGFGSYGFPESHAASFALLTYASCWLKCHEPAAFACALLNAQPLGFYTTAQIVQDARRHGIAVHPVDVRFSEVESSLEPVEAQGRVPLPQPAIRLGLREVGSLPREAAERVVAARAHAPFRDIEDLCQRADLDERARTALAEADALRGLSGHRHRARWAMAGVEEGTLPLFAELPAADEGRLVIRPPTASETTLADYASTGLTLNAHPMALLRPQLRARGYLDHRALHRIKAPRRTRTAGLVTLRQRPQTANGTWFLTLEDEHGLTNLICWRAVVERYRRAIVESQLLGARGRWEAHEGVTHLIVEHVEPLDDLLATLDGKPLVVEHRSFR
ncbi:error-prone DNA polymerase [Silanimonas sp.]|uniref:error-prone DNA polymerase n=1 Tax=Silanimonas sp. TaxID=1929290 RepID=UPI0022C40319|nr:error-prone DNA polymerase [Silanimonas sp.]MCZ8063564.1 error-prone DNA polymerase [Silanimonas sp.]